MTINKFFTVNVNDVLRILEFGGFAKIATDGKTDETCIYENECKQVVIAPLTTHSSAYVILIDKNAEN